MLQSVRYGSVELLQVGCLASMAFGGNLGFREDGPSPGETDLFLLIAYSVGEQLKRETYIISEQLNSESHPQTIWYPFTMSKFLTRQNHLTNR
jgi:hypothetical protein